jgi:hypothetical protein
MKKQEFEAALTAALKPLQEKIEAQASTIKVLKARNQARELIMIGESARVQN